MSRSKLSGPSPDLPCNYSHPPCHRVTCEGQSARQKGKCFSKINQSTDQLIIKTIWHHFIVRAICDASVMNMAVGVVTPPGPLATVWNLMKIANQFVFLSLSHIDGTLIHPRCPNDRQDMSPHCNCTVFEKLKSPCIVFILLYVSPCRRSCMPTVPAVPWLADLPYVFVSWRMNKLGK